MRSKRIDRLCPPEMHTRILPTYAWAGIRVGFRVVFLNDHIVSTTRDFSPIET